MSLDAVPVRGITRPVPIAEAMALSIALTALRAIRGGRLMAGWLEESARKGRRELHASADRALLWLDGWADGHGSMEHTDWCRAYDAVEALVGLTRDA